MLCFKNAADLSSLKGGVDYKNKPRRSLIRVGQSAACLSDYPICKCQQEGAPDRFLSQAVRVYQRGRELPVTSLYVRRRSSQKHATQMMLAAFLACLLFSAAPAQTGAASLSLGRHHSPLKTDRVHGYTINKEHIDYLRTYGYLPRSDIETQRVRSEQEVRHAIRKFQRFANIPESGEMDAETTQMMLKPRCGRPDVEAHHNHARGRHRRFVIENSHWEKRNLTYRIRNYTPDLNQTEIQAALRRAFELWKKVTNLTFKEAFYGEADMMVRFTRGFHHDGYPFDGVGNVLAHAFYPGSGTGGDIHFDEDETWIYEGKGKGVNLFSVAAHEIGHALGLSHSQVPPALMYPWYGGDAEHIRLHSDDIVAIQYFYGKKEIPSTTPVLLGSGPEAPIGPIPQAPSTTIPTTQATSTRHNSPGPTYPETGDRPDACRQALKVDAIARIRKEVFIFSGLWFWRVTQRYGVKDTKLYPIHTFWTGLPRNITHVDAVYMRHNDNKMIFFSGQRYWELDHHHTLSAGCPPSGKPLTDLGLPASLPKVDAAFVWSHNSMTYIISGNMYWRYNEHWRRMDEQYPRDMSMWSGVPIPLDAAFQYYRKTYFFKGENVWQFNDLRMQVRRNSYPKKWAEVFLDCQEDDNEISNQRRQLIANYQSDANDQMRLPSNIRDFEKEVDYMRVFTNNNNDHVYSKASMQMRSSNNYFYIVFLSVILSFPSGWKMY